MPQYLVARGIEDRDLALEDRDERIALIADAIEHIPNIRRALLAVLGEGRKLRRGQLRTRWQWSGTHGFRHPISVASPTPGTSTNPLPIGRAPRPAGAATGDATQTAPGWSASSTATPTPMRRRTSFSGSLLQIVEAVSQTNGIGAKQTRAWRAAGNGRVSESSWRASVGSARLICLDADTCSWRSITNNFRSVTFVKRPPSDSEAALRLQEPGRSSSELAARQSMIGLPLSSSP